MTFLYNLFIVITKVPALIGIIKAILDILGSETVRAVLQAIQDAVQKFKPADGTPVDDLPPQERKRFIDRIRLRVGQRLMGLNDEQFAATMRAFGREDEAPIA
jgi:hypothetical protein